MNYFVKNNGDDPDKVVFEKDMLFATLETSNRKIELAGNKTLILTDTVGFVSKLPHNLVEAFKATLEEVTEADLLVHVVDASNDNYDMQIDVTEQVLKELGVTAPSIYVFNKIDLVKETIDIDKYPQALSISAKNGYNMDCLVDEIVKMIFKDQKTVDLLIPYAESQIVSYMKAHGNVLEEAYTEAGTQMKVEVKEKDYDKIKAYVVPS